MTNKRTGRYPKCPSCGSAMVFTFAFPYKEYACLPCNETDEFLSRFSGVERSQRYMAAKKRKWSRDLSVIARTRGGGECALCKDGSCIHCKDAANPDYQFLYWKSNLRTTPLPENNK